MKTRIFQGLGVALLTLAVAGGAFAATIQGNITFAGGATLNTNSVNTATGVTTWEDTIVVSRDGDFATYLDAGEDVALFAPWTFNSAGPVLDFWSVGGFSFDLTSSFVSFQSSGALIVKGSGWTHGNGFDATPGTWNFTSQNPSAGGVFSFSAASAHPTSVPDGGTTAALMGAVLIGLGVIARWPKG